MKNKKILMTFIIAFLAILIFATKSQATLELNELNFDAKINADGSMDVRETWNIYVSDTNTLFKTFKRDSSKYSEITNVIVKDITSGKTFSEIYKEMYHVTKDCFYGLVNSNGMFEIAWGVGLDNSADTRKYEISYTVKDAIAKYNDYSELYWQFIGEDFEIPADKVKGTIIFPMNAESKEDIRVWGHTEDLNGEIYVTDLNKIEFTINNYRGKNYVEVRSLFPNNMIEATNRIYNYNILDKVIEEETVWAEDANARRERRMMVWNTVLGAVSIVSLFFVYKLFKNIGKLNKLGKKIKPSMKLDYYRELPYEDATPAEALFVMSDGITDYFSQSFAANILDLALKKYISIDAGSTGKGLTKTDIVKIKFTNEGKESLKQDEQLTLDFLKEVAQDSSEITTKDITKYLKKHTSKITKLDSKLEKILEKFETERGVFSKEKYEQHENYVGISVIYFVCAFLGSIFLLAMAESFAFSGIPILLLPGITWVINGIILAMMAHRTDVLSQKGVDEKEEWNAFKKYMEDFSLLKDKEIPSLVVWEKYLVFATAFGISDKVLKQLKVVYPEINNMDSSLYTYSYINLMNSVNIGDCINSSVYSAVGSSGSGAGGGFSGGGGGGRWPEVAAEDAKI